VAHDGTRRGTEDAALAGTGLTNQGDARATGAAQQGTGEGEGVG